MKTNRTLGIFVIIAVGTLLVFLLITQSDTFFAAINPLLMIAAGVGLGIFFAHRFGLGWGLYGAGALTMIASQVLHIPFNTYILNPMVDKMGLEPLPGSSDLLIAALLFGLSAGVFEETARYIFLRFWRKDARSWKKGLMFGAGHAGIEAIAIGLIAFLSFMQLVAYRQMDLQTLQNTISDPVQLEQLQTTVSTFWSAQWYEHLWGALERFSVLPIQLAATLLVMESLRRKNILWYLAAILWHTAVDALAVFGGQTWPIATVELGVVLFGLVGLGIIFALKKRQTEPDPPAEAPEIVSPASPVLPGSLAQEQSISSDSLEESRYE